MRTFQIEPTSLASCLFITYICIVFSFIIYVFGMFYGARGAHCALLLSPPASQHSNTNTFMFRFQANNGQPWPRAGSRVEKGKKTSAEFRSSSRAQEWPPTPLHGASPCLLLETTCVLCKGLAGVVSSSRTLFFLELKEMLLSRFIKDVFRIKMSSSHLTCNWVLQFL